MRIPADFGHRFRFQSATHSDQIGPPPPRVPVRLKTMMAALDNKSHKGLQKGGQYGKGEVIASMLKTGREQIPLADDELARPVILHDNVRGASYYQEEAQNA